ncbi:hypothetical protein [Paenibacillus sp. MER 99-2]|uniref:hypothetical protein n=1 Tax=Paenibacillus sp. MER 99-2 TaxID=2939572 RepID=UPI00203D7992|nr:hypothetical protein [Paenibacillus sp. MER 99-2]MCM3174870.1 hypothetical protein [Paenibacillus sp. MER 99-2]
MNQSNNDLTRKLLMNSNSRGVMEEVVPLEQQTEDTEVSDELTEETEHEGSFWESSDFAHEHEWQGQTETHAMFRQSYE